METWKKYENTIYFISSEGRVKSFKNGKTHYLKPRPNYKGYPMIQINHKKVFVHRLVAICFIPNPENKPCVNHINAVKDDNRVLNLEWCTVLENNMHAASIGKGTAHKACYAINPNNEVLGHFSSFQSAKKTLGCKKSIIIISDEDFNDSYREQMIQDYNRPRKVQKVTENRTLSVEQVQFIGWLLTLNQHTPALIGRLFNIDHSVIHGIKKGKLYKDITLKKAS